MKLITFAVPCYNSAAYMDRCIETLLPAGDEAEIILVDDGSTDDTGAIADRYAAQYPNIVRVIHQENGGHGEGVNQGVRNAAGVYFKVVDSDDWLDGEALQKLLARLRESAKQAEPVDMFVCNYVYEHVADGTRRVINYHHALPEDRVITWAEARHFKPSQFILMHAVVYRTVVLRASGLELPKHTFYVDNVFVYQPLPFVKTLCYLDLDLYRYYIGRADQSVTEENMIKRIDQQLRVTRIIMDAHDLTALAQVNKPLANYMCHYLSMMLMISTIYLMMSGTEENQAKSDALWTELRTKYPRIYRRMRYRTGNALFILPGRFGRSIDLGVYKMVRRIYKFN